MAKRGRVEGERNHNEGARTMRRVVAVVLAASAAAAFAFLAWDSTAHASELGQGDESLRTVKVRRSRLPTRGHSVQSHVRQARDWPFCTGVHVLCCCCMS